MSKKQPQPSAPKSPEGPSRSHAATADWCLEPIERAREAHEMHDDATGPLAIEEAKHRVAQALADQRRDHLAAQAACIQDGTPYGDKDGGKPQ